MKIRVPVEYDVNPELVIDLFLSVGLLLETGGKVPEPGGSASMLVNGNYFAQVKAAWGRLPREVQKAFDHEER